MPINTVDRFFFIFLCLTVLSSCDSSADKTVFKSKEATGSQTSSSVDIVFASCIRQWDPQPAWGAITRKKPKAFIFMGDNVYTDLGEYRQLSTSDRFKKAYQDQFSHIEFEQFLQYAASSNTKVYATWDDHDYGQNDAGKDFTDKLIAKDFFTRFFDHRLVASSPVIDAADQAGIYSAAMQTINGFQVHIILLDTRSFRSALHSLPTTLQCPRVHWGQNTTASATILGEQQWHWLKAELNKPADIRLVVSSIQVIPDQHCFEKWANFPAERDRLLALLSSKPNTVILSGDRHHAEISQIKTNAQNALYELTSSGLNSAIGHWGEIAREENIYRLYADRITQDNFGSLSIERETSGNFMTFSLHTDDGEIRQKMRIAIE